jgi:hypothetical protein
LPAAPAPKPSSEVASAPPDHTQVRSLFHSHSLQPRQPLPLNRTSSHLPSGVTRSADDPGRGPVHGSGQEPTLGPTNSSFPFQILSIKVAIHQRVRVYPDLSMGTSHSSTTPLSPPTGSLSTFHAGDAFHSRKPPRSRLSSHCPRNMTPVPPAWNHRPPVTELPTQAGHNRIDFPNLFRHALSHFPAHQYQTPCPTPPGIADSGLVAPADLVRFPALGKNGGFVTSLNSFLSVLAHAPNHSSNLDTLVQPLTSPEHTQEVIHSSTIQMHEAWTNSSFLSPTDSDTPASQVRRFPGTHTDRTPESSPQVRPLGLQPIHNTNESLPLNHACFPPLAWTLGKEPAIL